MLLCWKNKKQFKKKIPRYGHLIYTGFSSDIVRRLNEHKTGYSYGKRPPFTSQFHGNLELGYLEMYDSKKEAEDREIEIKEFGRDRKIELMQELSENDLEIIKKINMTVLDDSFRF